jgi:hypothetical protein
MEVSTMSKRWCVHVAALAVPIAMFSAVDGGATTFPYDGSYTGIAAGTVVRSPGSPCDASFGVTFQFSVVKGSITFAVPFKGGSGTVSASGVFHATVPEGKGGTCSISGTMTTTCGGNGTVSCTQQSEKGTWFVMRTKKTYVATLDEVRITREGDEVAIIEYLEPGISVTNFRIGPEIQGMTDQEVLDLFNDSIRAREVDESASQPPPEPN